jgi:hypothetical protein
MQGKSAQIYFIIFDYLIITNLILTIFTVYYNNWYSGMKELFKNVIDLKTSHRIFKNPAYSYSVSGRQVNKRANMAKYLQFNFIYIDIPQISSVFGSTTDPSELYGGRVYETGRSMNETHINELYNKNIDLALTLTNHLFTPELYKKNQSFLEKYYRPGNIIICTSDKLARMIRKDFPVYKLRASIIKNLNTYSKISTALDLYDDVVIPMDMNDDDEFLQGLPEKSRIMLFANAACAYSCKSRICYPEISKFNQSKTDRIRCNKQELGILEYGNYYFNVEKFHGMGFSNFKLIPAKIMSE